MEVQQGACEADASNSILSQLIKRNLIDSKVQAFTHLLREMDREFVNNAKKSSLFHIIYQILLLSVFSVLVVLGLKFMSYQVCGFTNFKFCIEVAV